MRHIEKPKLVRIIGRLNVGGPARQACYLHDALADTFETHLITGSINPGEEDMSYLLASKQNVYQVRAMSREVRFGADLRAAVEIYRILRRLRPDIVHTHTAKAGTLGRVTALLAGVPIRVHTFHGNVFEGYFSRWKACVYRLIERSLAKISTRIVAVCPSQAVDLVSKHRIAAKNKVVVVRNGFERAATDSSVCRDKIREHFGISDPRLFVIAWAGRMVAIKNVELLRKTIEACSQNQKVVFLVVGDGPDRSKLQSVLSQKNVKFLSWCRDMNAVWSAADAALLTSINEGTPTALVEAMMASKPFVSTDVGGVCDLVVGDVRNVGRIRVGSNGILVSSTPDAIIEGIDYLAEDVPRARAMGDAGYRFATAQYAADRLLRDLTALYNTHLDGRRAGGAREELNDREDRVYEG